MELCETCKNNKCSKKIITKQDNNVLIIKCLEYKKDENKIKGYRKPLKRTATVCHAVMSSLVIDWSSI